MVDKHQQLFSKLVYLRDITAVADDVFCIPTVTTKRKKDASTKKVRAAAVRPA